MEFCATSVGAGVQDLFPEGIEVVKSGTALGGSVGKWVSQSLEKSYIRENFEKSKNFKSLSECSGAGISMLGSPVDGKKIDHPHRSGQTF